MKIYRIVIFRHGRLLGQFDSETPWAAEAVHDLLQRLPEQEGYRTELFVAHDERRLIESGPGGLRLLGREPLFQPLPLAAVRADESTEPTR
ncbi:cytoplasmic protein [Tepidiphilus baoligensis]|uniref:Cytoplasmic protein n=1 Tax=Tepidiphilus baoligensis TaxID=2698687 RepID=A0ABX1QL00_9PROT|nr:cytoplasmic protein [Tepidiphilus baoligensis]NMH15883.1 cytoplasmic protein [Tepidiphilus baoligensis]